MKNLTGAGIAHTKRLGGLDAIKPGGQKAHRLELIDQY
jgi:hypothetical protein